MSFFYLMLIHKLQKIVCKLSYRKGHITPRRPSVSSGIYRIHMILFGKLIYLPSEVITVFSISVKEDKRETPPLFDVKMFNVH